MGESIWLFNEQGNIHFINEEDIHVSFEKCKESD